MIRHSDRSFSYSASDYDDDMCLKPPLLLWFALLFLCRGILLPIMIGMGHFTGVNADALTILRDHWSGLDLIASAMAAPVLFALIRRSAKAAKATRWIWSRGRILLTLAAVVDLSATLILLLRREANDDMILMLVSSSVDVYFLLYVLLASRVRDSFADFPLSSEK
jgi:hypothetical protein